MVGKIRCKWCLYIEICLSVLVGFSDLASAFGLDWLIE